MTIQIVYVVAALLIGVVAGLRTMTALAAVSWAASFGVLPLAGTRLAFFASPVAHWILTVAAVLELIGDQLPTTPSRKTPMQFAARIASGALCGAAAGTAAGSIAVGATAGVVGAVVGTLAGASARSGLAHAFRRDRPAALLEDAVAIAGAVLIVVGLFA